MQLQSRLTAQEIEAVADRKYDIRRQFVRQPVLLLGFKITHCVTFGKLQGRPKGRNTLYANFYAQMHPKR